MIASRQPSGSVTRDVAPHVRLLSEEDHAFVLSGFHSLLSLPADTESRLYHVLSDTLAHPGSLARAQLAFAIMNRPDAHPDRARSVAVAIEYFHTASLLFDDLPSMDNATERRGRPCPHLYYGEAAAQLGALSLITRAYALLWDAISELPANRRARAARLVEQCLGVGGILNGQSRDLHFGESRRTPECALDAARGKTVTLIRLTLVLPALVAGAPDPVLGVLEKLSEQWGLAYQVLDDFKDCFLSESETGKTIGRDAMLGRPNYVVAAGVEKARRFLNERLVESRQILVAARSPGWCNPAMARLQELMERETRTVERRLGAPA